MSQYIKLSETSGSYIGRGRKLYHVSYLPDFVDLGSQWTVKADSLFEAFAFVLAEHDCDPETLLQNLLSNKDDGLDGYEIGDLLEAQVIAPSNDHLEALFTVIALNEGAQIETIEVTANNALNAFAVAAERRNGVEFVAAFPSCLFAAGLVEFPGSAVVDAETVLQQPEVFSADG